MTAQPDHELEVLEDDQNVPPRPEELIADANRLGRAEEDSIPPADEPTSRPVTGPAPS
jgi:hypothetical protein